MSDAPDENYWPSRLDAQLLADLWIFRAAATHESITAAAGRLHVTQGAVSQRVLRLEARLGTPLFSRKSGRLRLTDAGETLLGAMDDVSEILRAALARFDRAHRTSLIVSCSPTIATEWLIPRLDNFYKLCPGIQLLIRSETLSPTLEFFEDEHVDLAIQYQSEARGKMNELWSLQELIFPVCSPDYATMTEANPTEITRLHDCVPWPGGPAHFEWERWLSHATLSLPAALADREFNVAHLAYQAALCGQGVAMARAVLVNRHLQTKQLVAMTHGKAEPAPGGIYRAFALRPGDARSPVRKLAHWLRDEMKATQDAALAMISSPA